MSRRFRIRGRRPLRGEVRVPGDKSIGHRALLFAALADGASVIEGLSPGLDNQATARALSEMGVGIEIHGGRAEVQGVGVDGLSMPSGAIDCGNSGTTMRLVAGILCGQRFGTRLVGDESLSRRPMRRIVEPLRARGAHIGGVSGADPNEIYAPLSVAPLVEGEHLVALEYVAPIASAQVKSCVLLSGLYANGLTAIREPTVSRDHTERMMEALGIPLRAMGPVVVLDPGGWERRWDGFEWEIPGDLSSAAFVLAAALTVEGSDVTVESVGLNPTRTGLLDALRAMRADLEFRPGGEGAGGEPRGAIRARHTGLVGAMTAGEMLTRMIDEVPVFCALAASARGRSDVYDAAELRHKESDRLTASVELLRAFEVDCTEIDDGMHIHGGPLRGAEVESHGDHRIAMMGAVLGMAAEGETVVHDVDCVETSFPGFVELFASLGADIVVEDDS